MFGASFPDRRGQGETFMDTHSIDRLSTGFPLPNVDGLGMFSQPRAAIFQTRGEGLGKPGFGSGSVEERSLVRRMAHSPPLSGST